MTLLNACFGGKKVGRGVWNKWSSLKRAHVATAHLVAVDDGAPVEKIGLAQVRWPIDIFIPDSDHNVGDNAPLLQLSEKEGAPWAAVNELKKGRASGLRGRLPAWPA